MDFLKVLLNANPLLEDVAFGSFRISPSLGSVSTDGVYLPRLKKLSVHRLDHLNELFSGGFLPSLSKLQFFPRDEEGQVQIPNLSDIFLPILQLCQSSVNDLELSDGYGPENAELSSGNNDVVELRQAVSLKFHRGSVNLVKLFSHFTFGKLKLLELDRTSISVQDVGRLLVGSHLTLESIVLGGSKRKRKGKDVGLLKGCSFPNLKILNLRKGSSHMLELFGQAPLAKLQHLEVDFVDSLESPGTDDPTNLEQADFYSFVNLMKSTCRTLVKATFDGLAKEGEEASFGLSTFRPASFLRLEELIITLHNKEHSFLDPFGKCQFPFLCKLRMSTALPEPRDSTFEEACKKIISTSTIRNLKRAQVENQIIIYTDGR